jgi:Bacterial regulatory proteins, gntR family
MWCSWVGAATRGVRPSLVWFDGQLFDISPDQVDLFLSAAERRRGVVNALYERVREAIAEGRVRPGEPLPASRALARQLSISRHGVTTAYGYLVV